MNSTKKGMTLIELTVGLGVLGAIMTMNVQNHGYEQDQLHAKAMGKEIYQYNSAVSRYLADINSTLTSDEKTALAGSTRIGSSWLKDSSCEYGSGSSAFIDCSALPPSNDFSTGSTLSGKSQPSTTFYLDGEAVKATTAWTPASTKGKASESFMGLAALVAAGSYVEDGSYAEAENSTLYCPDMDYHELSIKAFCEGNKGMIVSKSSPVLASGSGGGGSIDFDSLNDQYLSTQGLNTMRSYLEFKSDGTPSSQAELDAVDSSTWRQIVNVARIYNKGDSGEDSIILGSRTGEAIYSNSFFIDNNLLKNSVIVDGDLGVSGSLLVAGDISAKNFSTETIVADDIQVGQLDIAGSLRADHADIGEIDTYGDITITNGDLRVKSLEVDGDATANRLNVSGFLSANGIKTEGALNTKEIIMTLNAQQGDICEFNGSINYNNNTAKILVCVDNAWEETRYLQTGGIQVPENMMNNHFNLFHQYVYDASGGIEAGASEGYYEVSKAVFDNAYNGLATFGNTKCQAGYSGFMRYIGNGTFQCIST